ncbi:hypothetical protein STCU_03717 [Strigomonas culicis]|uniref:RIIa domain-containing protein n=1 Tax=Strigomonas culicis TaxID=28005 RepID=S9VUY0_9TRYP|nr:hypothetical protein STCU_03717 [Strigomonas culicis]|eukprot:EPY30986.1 hypothetical protein STCU_03717 [Strigomonas culicis]
MNSIYSVEQVNIPPELGTILKQYTKAVIRDKPNNVYKYSANFFAMLSGKPIPFEQDGEPEGGTFDGKSIFSKNDIGNEKEHPENATDHGDTVEVSEEDAVNLIFARYGENNDGNIPIKELPALLEDNKKIVLGLGNR